MQVEGIDIPGKWIELLADLKKLSKSAVIAGGAIRDKYIGQPHKDLDFFTTVFPQWGLLEKSSFDYEGMKYVVGVASLKLDGIDINLIMLEQDIEPMALIDSFDFGLCQIAFDGEKIIRSKAFEWDMKYGVMTMRHTDRYQRSIKRWCRIGQRIGYDIKIPQLESKADALPL